MPEQLFPNGGPGGAASPYCSICGHRYGDPAQLAATGGHVHQTRARSESTFDATERRRLWPLY